MKDFTIKFIDEVKEKYLSTRIGFDFDDIFFYHSGHGGGYTFSKILSILENKDIDIKTLEFLHFICDDYDNNYSELIPFIQKHIEQISIRS